MSAAFARRRAFTLTEVLVVMGLIGVLVGLFMPVVGKARAASDAVTCASNLRQMGTAWTMYAAQHRGRFPAYVWRTPRTPNVAWNGYWPGIMVEGKVADDALLCPAASTPADTRNRGYGSAALAWSGRDMASASVARFNPGKYRVGSYGYNRYVTAGGGFPGSRTTAVKNPSDVPLMLDAAFLDFQPGNGSPARPVTPPPNLTGEQVASASPQHWLFLLARHGRGVNCLMMDGSVRHLPLEESYQLTWKSDWVKYRLSLPAS
jgi:prepilin-type N-terminal cleavage/methylation domain-containing protein/prepilin-type processing-associated H-X9-DG protein